MNKNTKHSYNKISLNYSHTTNISTGLKKASFEFLKSQNPPEFLLEMIISQLFPTVGLNHSWFLLLAEKY